MKTLRIILALSLCIAITGCDTLAEWQKNPNVIFAETQVIKLAQAYFSNGGNVDTLWGISNGVNFIGDVTTFAIQQKQAKDSAAANAIAASQLKQQVKAFADDKTAVNGFASGLSAVMATSNAKTPEERSKVTLAIAATIQKVAAEAMP